jgi:hypothetical protein
MNSTLDLPENSALNLQNFPYLWPFWHFPCMKVKNLFLLHMEMDVLHWGGGSWKKTEALAWNANALTRAKTNALPLARTWRGIRTDCPTSHYGREIRFAMSFPDWREPEPTQALNSKKMPPPNRARMAGGGEGHRVERRNSTHRVLYHRSLFCQLENSSG